MASKTKAKAKGRSESPAQGEKTASTPSRSTAPDRVSEQKLRRARLGRRILLGAMIAFVGLGLAGVLGQRTATVTARSNGYELAVTYGSVVRPGVPIRWNVNVHRDGGFQGPIDVEVSRHYFDLFDTNSLRPDASSATSDGPFIIWSFDPPRGEDFTIAFDSTVETGEHLGADGIVAVLAQGRPAVEVRVHTREVP